MDPTSSELPGRSPEEMLDRYLAGEASSGEAEFVKKRLAHRMDAGVRLHDSATYVHTMGPGQDTGMKPGMPEHEHAWEQLCARIDTVPPIAPSRAARFPRYAAVQGTRRQWWYGTAAMTVAAVSLAVIALLPGNERTASPLQHAPRVFATAPGQQATVTLADGSIVVLGPATTLNVTADPHTTGTTVTLVGQAQFTVTPNTKTPFTVRTSQSLTRVLGTTFAVRQYAAERSARIIVSEGRVALQAMHDSLARGQHTVLEGQMLGVVTDSGQVVVARNVSAAQYTAWTNGKLVFDDTPVREVVADLARAYAADIRIEDSTLAHQPITWNVQPRSYPLAEALSELATLLNAHVRMTGTRMTIVPGRRAAQRRPPLHHPFSLETQYGK